MPSILSALYRGNYSAFNRAYDPASEYCKISSRLSDLEDEIERALDSELRDKFKKYVHLNGDLNIVGGEGDFIEGFRLGVRLMLAALSPEE